MSRKKSLAAILGAAVLMAVVAACSQSKSATPTPTVAPVDTPTAVDGGKLLEGCFVTEIGPRENPVLVARGLDPIPSGFDAGNIASCTFARPISAVKLELLRDGKAVLQQVIPIDAPTTDVSFPLPETPAPPIGPDLDTGGYDHRITATTEDGEEAEVLFNADAIWVLDPDSSPKDLARPAMIAAREAFAVAQAVPYFGPAMVVFEPVEWNDASLGCPKPDVFYAQVITPGFRLVFEHEGRRYEYHTNQDGSTVVDCGEATPPEPRKSAADTAGIEALQIDGVWVFQHQPEAAMDALHGGTPEIVDGCLVVDNTIVVWHVDRIDEATEAIAAVKAGESTQLLIGGGGISVDEGDRPDQIPTVITDRCPTSAVWFGAP